MPPITVIKLIDLSWMPKTPPKCQSTSRATTSSTSKMVCTPTSGPSLPSKTSEAPYTFKPMEQMAPSNQVSHSLEPSSQKPSQSQGNTTVSAVPSTTTGGLGTAESSRTVVCLPHEVRQKILLFCYDDGHERVAKHFATCSTSLQAHTYDILIDSMIKKEWRFQLWLSNCMQTAVPQFLEDIEHVGKVVRARQERMSAMVLERQAEEVLRLWT